MPVFILFPKITKYTFQNTAGGREGRGARQAKPSQEPRQTTPTTGARRPSRRAAPRSHSLAARPSQGRGSPAAGSPRGRGSATAGPSQGRGSLVAGSPRGRGSATAGPSWERRRRVATAGSPSRRSRRARPLPATAEEQTNDVIRLMNRRTGEQR
jgi:hypothetical protein